MIRSISLGVSFESCNAARSAFSPASASQRVMATAAERELERLTAALAATQARVEEESRLAAVQQAAFVVTDDRTELLARALQGKTHVTSIECLGLLEMKNEKREQMEIAGMLRALGWSKRTNGVQKFWVAPLTTSTSERWSEGGQYAGTFG